MKHTFPLIIILLTAAVVWPDTVLARRRNAARRESAAELFKQAVDSADAYRFAAAASLLERCEEAIPARGKSPVEEADMDILRERVERGKLMMDRVEKIVVIDSVTVPLADFFEHYRLDPAAGTLRTVATLPQGVEAVKGSSVFVPERGGSMIWSAPDTAGRGVIAEVSILADGSLEPVTTHPELNIEAEDGSPVNAVFPFLMADGVTLYYATDNPELSLGGYDIFFTRRDGDGFMQPQNMGMPYNSPANDYLLAIDEITGTGWWATDRHCQGTDSVTIYRFIPNELRVNYISEETPNLPSLARLDNYRATQPAGADYTELHAKPVRTSGDNTTADFRLSIPGRGIVTSVNNLRTPQGKAAARQWLQLRQRLATETEQLDRARRDYASGRHDAEGRIRSLEQSIPALRREIKTALNDVVIAETR